MSAVDLRALNLKTKWFTLPSEAFDGAVTNFKGYGLTFKRSVSHRRKGPLSYILIFKPIAQYKIDYIQNVYLKKQYICSELSIFYYDYIKCSFIFKHRPTVDAWNVFLKRWLDYKIQSGKVFCSFNQWKFFYCGGRCYKASAAMRYAACLTPYATSGSVNL